MTTPHRLFGCLAILLLGCAAAPEVGHPDAAADLSSAPDLSVKSDGSVGPDGAAGDGGGCIGLSECSCWDRRASCQPIAESCWCPMPKCGPGACICGGGSFLGCAPQASGCAATVHCLPAGRPGPQNDKGCIGCAYQNGCDQAFAQMVGTCTGQKGRLDLFSCTKNPACVTDCINKLARCEDIGCGLCSACGCAFNGPFETCYFACVK